MQDQTSLTLNPWDGDGEREKERERERESYPSKVFDSFCGVFDRLASCICICKGFADEVAYAAIITSCSEHWRRSLWLVHCMSRASGTISQNAFNAACRSIFSFGNAHKDSTTHTWIYIYIWHIHMAYIYILYDYMTI